MRNRLTRFIFPFVAILLLAPWPVAYAYENGMVGQEAVQIRAAEASAAPGGKVFGRAIGSITPGDLFYVDATRSPADILATMHLTNTQELYRSYRYLILQVGVYVESGSGEWGRASWAGGELIPDTFLTLQTGKVSFSLAGYANYRVAIDKGSFYCLTTSADGGSLSPQFYLAVD
ncbi:hypothetical protein ACFLYE_00330 [Chloroflexota bacterium]